ncbi:MAG: AAA family ATPase [Candidatus Eremiobacteraeota bacterium]|nr:AAA family ATPase [Candidatus Eremiobacteraeota bacterium]
MSNIINELRTWATELPYWEQASLEKILSGIQLNDSDYNELLEYLLEDANSVKKSEQRPNLCFPKVAIDISQAATGPARLIKIFNLQNINALVPGQSLTFGPTLTAIYGANASGKSGYARVIGCAGFTRGNKEVLPNIMQATIDDTIQTADIEIFDGNSKKVIHYKISSQCPELCSFYMFDSTSVQVHLTKSNMFSFSPSGLSYLTRLADVTDEVRKRLCNKISEYSQPHNFGPLFRGESEVTELIANLGPDTDLGKVKKVAKLSPDEERRAKELDVKIAQLKSQNIPKQIMEIKQTITDLENFAGKLQQAKNNLNDKVMAEIANSIKVYIEREKVAKGVSVDQFKSKYFSQTGSNLWLNFVNAAKVLADAEQAPEKPYPQKDSHCLLCQQALSPEAYNLIIRLWKFLEGEAQTALKQAQIALNSHQVKLQRTDLAFSIEQSVSYRHIEKNNKELLKKIMNFLSACRKRQESALDNINTSTLAPIPPLPASEASEIANMIKALKLRQVPLQDKDPTKEISELEKRILELRHRKLLSQYLPQIEKYVKKQIWTRRAIGIGGNTTHITRKNNELFNKLVTKRYIELFEKTLKDLQRPLKVEIRTRGRKGNTYKQIVLSAIPSTSGGKATPDKVLSEGEKRAIALADFLTEVALDITSSGIILDDPVTSLDLEWRETIACILANEAQNRQVIVFTHDLPFLYHLKKYAEEKSIEIITHWIKRGDSNDKPGYVFLNNSPALEKGYCKSTKAREFYKKAKNASAEEQESLLRQGFGALRASYEAFIIFNLFNEVVLRFNERISFGRLKDIVWDESIAQEIIKKCELLSKYIEGHLHSDAFAAKKPTCKILIREIEDFDTLRKKLKDLKINRSN